MTTEQETTEAPQRGMTYKTDDERNAIVVTVIGPWPSAYSKKPYVQAEFSLYDNLEDEGAVEGRINVFYPGDDPGYSWNRNGFYGEIGLSLDEMKALHRALGRALRGAERKVARGEWC